MNYKKVVVAGGGVLGSQIAFQSAYCGFDVTILVRNDDDQTVINKKLLNLKNTYIKMINAMDKKEDWARGIIGNNKFNYSKCLKQAEDALSKITINTNQEEALKGTDLLIESITENLEIKKAFYSQISDLLPKKTIVVTNSSTLLPSALAESTGRPEKFLALHFANSIWKNNTAEVMGHELTNKRYFNELIEFANAINMIPLPVVKEKSGYLLNSMLVPFLLSAMDLVANGISDPESIDKAWTLGTGSPHGPFQIIDTVGLVTAKNIVEQYQKVPRLINPLLKKMMLPYNYKAMLKLLNDYIEKGKLGKSTKEGFYKYK